MSDSRLGPGVALVVGVWCTLVASGWFAAAKADESTGNCAPGASSSAPLDARELAGHIDGILAAAWARDGVQPAPTADDAEFLRRVSLDVIGKIPSVAELQQFLADSGADKRQRVVDDLLRRGAHAQHFANTWRGLMLAGAAENIEARIATPQFETWLRLRFAVNAPYDRLVSELLTAPVEEAAQPGARPARAFVPSPAAFFQANEQKPEMIAASTTRIFLGVQVQCAQCHDHPFAHWTRREFWSLAAFFNVPGGPAGRSLPKAETGSANAIRIPETQIVVEPAFLDGSQPDWQSGTARRELLARWITQTDNPFFARAAVNRLWEHFLGRGFVHPVDDLDKANPPSHPELLDALARQFALHQFDLNYLIRALTATRAYGLSSRCEQPAGDDDLARFARMPLRRMTADQLFASIAQATGFREERKPAQRGVVLPDLSSAAAEFRGRFADQSVPRTEAETSILQALTLMNGKLVSDATDLAKSETLVAVAEAPFLSHAQRVETLFMAALSRKPQSDELAEFVSYVESGGSNQNSKQALADVFWALLNSAEFALVH